MSRAFTKEPDADAPIELHERPIGPERNIVTRRGLRMIESSLEEARQALSVAQSKDDRMETAKAMRDIEYWSARHASAELVEPDADPDKVQFGTRFTVQDENEAEKSYCIVGIDEAEPSKGYLSYISPLAQKLIGKKPGDFIETENAELQIVRIENC